MKKILILFIFTVLFLFAGCTTPPQDTQTDNNQENNEESSTTSSNTDDDDSSNSQIAKEIAKILESAVQEYTVEYELTSEAQGQKQTITTANYYDLPNRARTDASLLGLESSSYWVDGSFYSCSKDDSWSCYEFGSDSDSYEEFPQNSKELTEKEGSLDKWEYAGEQTHAGVSTSCFKITQSTKEGTAEFCFSDGGVLLYMNFFDESVGGILEMQATSYKESVSDSDFELPADPQSFDIPSYPGFE